MLTLVLIDGHSLLHRAYHALPPLSLSSGQPTGAVYGFSSMLLKVLNGLKPDYLAVAFDTKGPTFRHKKFPEYKAHRPEVEPELVSQIRLVKQVVDAFGFKRYEQPGYEGDDVIGTIISQVSAEGRSASGRKSKKENPEIIVVTGDLDILQLVDENVKVYTSKRGFSDTVIYDKEAVEERYGIPPRKLVDYKGIVGDASDNIPGVKGVGAKGAGELLTHYKSLDDIYEHLGELPDRWKAKLSTQKDGAFLSRELAVIKVDVPILFELGDCRLMKIDHGKVRELFKKLRFDSLIRRLPSARVEEQGGLFR